MAPAREKEEDNKMTRSKVPIEVFFVSEGGNYDDALSGWKKPPAKADDTRPKLRGAPVNQPSHEFKMKKLK
jgi:hypothetical protein